VSKVWRTGILAFLGFVLLLGAAALIAPYTEPGIASAVGSDGVPLLLTDYSGLPRAVIDGANDLADELFEDYPEEREYFVSQLLALYVEARDEDFVIFFNAGGWGWNLLEDSPGWQTIFDGIEAELEDWSYSSLRVNYLRAADTLRGRLNEVEEMISRYQLTAQYLASRVDFLLTYIPDIRIILAGESTGTMIANGAMEIIGDNPQVYSIQTGPPFWIHPYTSENTLVMTDNGLAPDCFSHANLFEFIFGYVRYWLGFLEPEDDFGTTPHVVTAPGHDYWWQYPEVCSRITDFLNQHFGFD
jgi:hypothetical protein